MSKLAVIIAMTKFLFHPSFSTHKLSNIRRYSQLYSHALNQKNNKICNDISNYNKQQQQQLDKNSIQAYISTIKTFIAQKNSQTPKTKIQNNINQIKSFNFKQLLQNYIKNGFQYLSLYYQSLQNLVEGKRQVLQNQNFIFDDGKTVKQKSEQMEKLLRKLINNNNKNNDK